jgi:hypothetical protein
MKKKNLDTHRKLLAILVLVSVVFTLMAGAYFYHAQSMGLLSQSSYFHQMKNWVDKERAYLQNKSNWESQKKQTKLASTSFTKERDAAPLQFEFYQTLPTMQVTVQSFAQNSRKSLDAERGFEDDKPRPQALTTKMPVKKEKKLISSTKLFNAETLKRDLARELNLK